MLSYTRPPANLVTYREWFLFGNDDTEKIVVLDSKRHHKKTMVLLEGLTSKEKAESYVGKQIYVDKNVFQPSSEGQFLWLDLLGMQVWDQYGERLGTVCRLFETGANDVLEVVSSSGEKTLIPFVMDTYIREVNLDRRKIEVDWFS